METQIIKLTLCDQTVLLLPERAAFWVEKKILIMADLHIGKTAALQKIGIPIPDGSMEDDLICLRKLIVQWGAEQCIIVGDLIHAKIGLSEKVIQSFGDWCQEVPCQIMLVPGNHDWALKKTIPSSWNLQVYPENYIRGPFCFSHFPLISKSHFVWSAHLHPQILLKSENDRIVLRCFQLFDQLCILPAFSLCVGGSFIKKEKECRIFPTTGNEIFELTQ